MTHCVKKTLACAVAVCISGALASQLPESWTPHLHGAERRFPVVVRVNPGGGGGRGEVCCFTSGERCVRASTGLFGRLDICEGQSQVASIKLNTDWSREPKEGDEFSFDEVSGTGTWRRHWTRPDGKDAVLSYSVSKDDGAKVVVTYDLGVTEPEARSFAKPTSFVFSLDQTIKKDDGRKYGFDGKWHVPFAIDELQAVKGPLKQKWRPVETRNSPTLAIYPEIGSSSPVTVTFPDYWMGSAAWYESLTQSETSPLYVALRFFGVNDFSGNATTKGRIVIDLGASRERVEAGFPPTGGIDFWGDDALHVPPSPVRNLMVNGGFEQGFKGWRWQFGGTHWADVPPGQERHGIVDGGRFGRKALAVRSGQPKASPLWSTTMPVTKGRRYVLSWYDIASRPTSVRVAACSAAPTGSFGNKDPLDWRRKGEWSRAGTEWTRHVKPFVASSSGVFVQIVGSSGDVRIDGVQVEEGDGPTEYVESPVLGVLATSDPDNNVSEGHAIDARLILHGTEGWTGKVRVRIKNAYSEILYDRTHDVVLPCAPLALDVSPDVLGCGVFSVRTDFIPGAGLSWTDYHRFSVATPLKNEHPTAKFYCVIPWFGRVERGRDVARKMREWGLGSADGINNYSYTSGPYAKLFRESGMKGTLHPLTYDMGWTIGFFKWDEVTPERQTWIETNAYNYASACAEDDTLWTFGNEEDHFTRRLGFEAQWKCVEACYRGCKRAFDERGLKLRFAPTHGVSHYFRGRNHDLVDGYLETAKKHGFMYDAVTIHAYSNIDGGILGPHDADQETQHLIDCMRHYGYPEETPILISEAFNMLPFRIPEWGADGWGDFVVCGPPSQDIGIREFVQAASMMRMYLIYLKYWPKVELVHNWQFRPGFMDVNLTPYLWLKAVNTLGHLLPDPRFVGDARPFADIRGYVYRQGEEAVLAIWTTNHEVELGKRKGPTLILALPEDARFADFMGNARTARKLPGGGVSVPLTAAPLFVVSRDAAALLAAVRNAESDNPATAVECDIRPTYDGSVAMQLENVTSRPQKTPFGEIAPKGMVKTTLAKAKGRKARPMEMRRFSCELPFIGRRWTMDYFRVPRCADRPDWEAIPALSVTNAVLRRGSVRVDARAELKMAWNDDFLFIRLEAEDDNCIPLESYASVNASELWRMDGCMEVYFDALGDARGRQHKDFADDDSRYDFANGKVHRQVAVNWQLAQGTASATDEEIRGKVIRSFKRTKNGYVHEVALSRRYLAPIDLKRGTQFGFGLFLHDRDKVGDTSEHGLSLSSVPGQVCNGHPQSWPMAILE